MSANRAAINKLFRRAPYFTAEGQLQSKLRVIDSKLAQIRKGRGYRSQRRLLRRERDRVWAEYCGLKLANS